MAGMDEFPYLVRRTIWNNALYGLEKFIDVLLGVTFKKLYKINFFAIDAKVQAPQVTAFTHFNVLHDKHAILAFRY